MSRPFRLLPLLAFFLLVLARSATAQFVDDDEEAKKKKAEAERTRRAFDALMIKAEEEYRVFFKKPKEVHEFWAAIRFEMDVGKFDLAALHLKLMLEIPADKADPELLKIADRDGLGAFTRLQEVRIWSVHEPFQKEAEKNVQNLLERLRKALETRLADPERIGFFINNLGARTREEREFAKAELNRSRERAVPYLIDALKLHAGRPLADRLVEYMVEMEDEMVPPFLEVFKVQFSDPGDEALKALRDRDAQDPMLRLTLLDVIKKRNDRRRDKGFADDTRVAPYLWHIAGTGKSRIPYHPLVRQKAREMLAYLLRTTPDRLPRSEIVLTDMAGRMYRKEESFGGKEAVPLWRWDSAAIAAPLPTDPKKERKPILITRAQAQEIFAQRYAREALDLAPGHQPAQIVLLSQQMDSLYRPEVSKFLLDRPAPEWKGMDDLLARVDVDLLSATLEKALDENNLAVALGSLRALGRRGDPLGARAFPAGPARGVVRALDFPDRRVQWAALQAIVSMPGTPSPLISTRLVDLLRRQLTSDGQPRALAIGVPDPKAPDLRNLLKENGFVPVLERDFKLGFRRLKESPDFDLVILHANVGAVELPYMVNQIRADIDAGVLPIVVIAPTARTDDLTKDTEEKDRLAGIKIIEDRVREELLKKKHEVEIKTKDKFELVKLHAELDRVYGLERERRLKEFADAFALEVASRRLARTRTFEERLRRGIVRQRHVSVIPEMLLGTPDDFKRALDAALGEAFVARMTPEERSLFARQALGLLWGMGRGDPPGYNIAPAQDALLALARGKATPPDTALFAVEALSRLPGTTVQHNLAAIALDPARDKLRMPAAFELNRHVKTYGVLLSKDQVAMIRKAYADPAEKDDALKAQLALVLGAIGSTPALTGDRLFDFRPGPAAPPPMKEEKKKDE